MLYAPVYDVRLTDARLKGVQAAPYLGQHAALYHAGADEAVDAFFIQRRYKFLVLAVNSLLVGKEHHLLGFQRGGNFARDKILILLTNYNL